MLATTAAAAVAGETPGGRIPTETMVLRVRLNTVEKGDIFVERTPGGDFLVKVQDLQLIGFRDPSGQVVPIDGEPYMSLRSMKGVSFELEPQKLVLDITADPQLLPSQAIAARTYTTQPLGTVPANDSAYVNYAFSASGADRQDSAFALSAEAGVRVGGLLFRSDANMVTGAAGERRLVRLMSSVTRDDREELVRTTVGDFFTPSRDFSTGVSLGGVSVSKLFGLNPYFIQFPLQSVGGSVALPSDLEVYIDGQRIRTERLRPGDFEVRDILAYGGARNVQVVLRDAFGRVQQLNYSFYFSDQPLRQGLHEYSYNAGWMRREYGVESNRYGPAAGAMFHRYGVNNRLTLGWRAEATERLLNMGPLVTAVLGSAGVASLALAGSSVAGARGAAAVAAYNFQTRDWSIGVSGRRDWGTYASLGDPPVVTNRRAEGSVSASYHWHGRGTLSMTHSLLHTSGRAASLASPQQPYNVIALTPQRITSLSYGVPIVSGRASLSASWSHVKKADTSRNEFFVGLTVFLDRDHSAGATYRGDPGSHSAYVQLSRRQPVGEGLGYTLSATAGKDPVGATLASRSSVQYNAPAAVLHGEHGRTRDRSGQWLDDYRVSVAGGVGVVGGQVGFGRPIMGSFGIVKVGQLPGVRVVVNGQDVGTTNERGTVFVPTLTPFHDNQVAIAPENVPIEYAFDRTARTISPAAHGGAFLEFGVSRIQAFTGTINYVAAGERKPVEFQDIRIETAGMKPIPVGRGGEFYLENLPPGRYRATVPVNGKRCEFELVIPASSETFVDLGEQTCELP